MLSLLFELIWPLIYANCLFGISTIAISNEPIFIQIVTFSAAVMIPLRGVYYIIISLVRGNKIIRSTVIQTVCEILIGAIIVLLPSFSYKAFVIVYEVYLSFYIAVKIIDTVIYSKNGVKRNFVPSLIQALLFTAIFVLIIVLPVDVRKRAVEIGVGISVSLLGLGHISDFLSMVIKNVRMRSVLNSIRITMPGVVAVTVPHRLIHSIRNAKPGQCGKQINAEVFFHFGKGGLGTVGHCELCIDGRTFTYGNYDPSSRKVLKSLGKGVILRAKRDEYIDWCVNKHHKMVIAYGLHLTDKDMQSVRNRISELEKDLVPWGKEAEELPEKEYAKKITRNVNTEIYSIENGRFKTYFTPTINCVKLLDYFLCETPIGQMILPGICTPGAYMDVLQRLYDTGSDTVVSLKTYGIK